jgi:membrane protein implicated in regulation of membrane protease activity
MSITTWWWLACLALVGAELVTGTFYLLMAALGLAAGALLSYADTTLTQQITVAALVSAGAVVSWHAYRLRTRQAHDNDPMDVGQTVNVTAWQADGTARVHHRGADWTALPAPGHAAGTLGVHTITAVDGARLRIAPNTPAKH